MPNFSPPVKDLVSRMLCLDPSMRITISQIKAHACFRLHIPPEYVCPSPLPVPSFHAPVDFASISPDVLDLLRRIGYRDDEELKEDFSADCQTMAKVFYFMLTSQISIEQLSWDESVGGFARAAEDEAIMVGPVERAFTLSGDGLFHRHAFSEPQSVELASSAASAAEWALGDARATVFEQVHVIAARGRGLTQAMAALQGIMRQLDLQWFHPDDETIFCRREAQGLYVVVQAKDSGGAECATTIQLQLCAGTGEAFSVVVHAAIAEFG
jgi:BR serine/threonine kinase